MLPIYQRFKPAIALLILTIIWGYSWVLAKQGLTYAGPFSFVASRCFGSALALMVVLKLTGRPLRPAAPMATLLIALFQVAAFMSFQTWALVEGGAGKTAVLIFTMPIWTMLIAWPVLGERILGRQWFAAISTLVGLILIIEPWNMHTSLLSKCLGLTAALCWAIGTVLVKRLRQQTSTDLLSLTAWQMLMGSIPLLALSWLIPANPTQWTIHYIGILIFMSILATAFGWWLWIYILDKTPAWKASLSVLGTPVVAILSSRLSLGEEFKTTEISGIMLIGCGLALLSFFGWLANRRLSLKVGKPI